MKGKKISGRCIIDPFKVFLPLYRETSHSISTQLSDFHRFAYSENNLVKYDDTKLILPNLEVKLLLRNSNRGYLTVTFLEMRSLCLWAAFNLPSCIAPSGDDRAWHVFTTDKSNVRNCKPCNRNIKLWFQVVFQALCLVLHNSHFSLMNLCKHITIMFASLIHAKMWFLARSPARRCTTTLPMKFLRPFNIATYIGVFL